MKKKILLCSMFLLFILPVKADTCSVTDKMKFKKMAGFIETTYYPYDEGNEVRFSLIINNVDDFTYYTNKQLTATTGEYGELRFSGLIPGESYTFYFYANSGNCLGTEIYNKTIVLPNYNKFYNDPVCNGKDEFYLCNKWKEHNLSYDEFVKQVNEYKPVEKQNIEINEENVKSFWDILIEIYLKYYFVILIPIIIILISLIIYLRKKDDLLK